MTSATTLPPGLRDRLAAAERRIRRLRLLQGISLLTLVLVLLGGAALLLDAWLDLPRVVRVLLLAGWAGTAAGVGVFGLLIPLCRRLDPEALAAAIEDRYPALGERLTSTVELTGVTDPHHGSLAFVALLARETEARTRRLDLLRAFPGRRAAWLAGAALTGLFAAGLPALLWSGPYADLGGRFLFAWRTPARVVPYRLDVTPGDTVAAAGRPLTFTARVQLVDARASLPLTCTWVRTDAAGNTARRLMQVDRADAFSFRLEQVPGDFRYHVEAGEVASPDFQVTAVPPVELAADSPTITITPPAYAAATVEPQTVLGVSDLAALQHSRITFDFRFTRPAVAALVQWSPAKGGQERQVRQHPLTLSPDGCAGRLELPAVADGTFQVILEAEHGIRTEPEPRTLTVKPDQPPAFIKVSGRDELKAVHPYEAIPVEMELADDVGVDRVELEYRVNDGPSVFEPIALEGQGTRQARGRHTFQLAGKVKEGDVLRYRLKAADNRNVPEAGLKPNVTYYPAEEHGEPRWRTLKIARRAVPLKQQEIAAQQDDFERKRDAIQQKVKEELAGLNKLREETRRQATLDPPPAKDLGRLREQNRAVEHALRELARDADATPGLAPLADGIQEMADQEMRRSDKALGQSARATEAEARERDLQKADAELRTVSRKLDELRRRGEEVARARLEQTQLEELANRQEQLARRTAEQAAADPIKDAQAGKTSRELKQDQQELADELTRQAEKSDTLRKALDAARAEEARQLAEQAKQLAQAERDLAEEVRAQEQKDQQQRFAELARQQERLAKKVRDLAQESRQPAQAAQTTPLRPDDAQQAAEALKKGRASAALQDQEQAARELERLARKLEQAVEQAADPKEMARQLSRLQESLREQLQQETRKPDAAEPLAERVRRLRREQEALQRAVDKLSVPEKNTEAMKDHREAATNAARAAEALEKGDPRQAEARMNDTRRDLNRLASKLPSLAERRAKALAELAQLRKKQGEVAREAEKAVREQPDPDKLKGRLAETTKRQAEIADRLEKLDTPNQEEHREATQRAGRRALEDLKEARAKKINPSQQEAQKQLQRLEDALAANKPGQKPGADQAAAAPQGLPSPAQVDQARQLAREQRELRAAVEKAVKAAPPSGETAAQQARQQELRQKTGELTQNLNRLGQEMQRTPSAQQQARQAARSGLQAENAMRRAQEQARQGQGEPAHQARQQAAQALDQAARQAEQAGREMAARAQNTPPGNANQPSPANARTGQDLQQAQRSMRQAQQQLNQGQNQGAQGSMQQAAQALQQAARQLAQSQPGQPANTEPGKLGAAAQGRPDPGLFGTDMKQYAGKAWGELPGELRTKILQDMKARYGEDYARIIKLYFEELADRK